MKTLKSALTLSVMVAFASVNAFAEGDRIQQPGYARAGDDGGPAYPAYWGIGGKYGLETPGAAFSTGALDLADAFPDEGEDERGFGKWSSSDAGCEQPGKGAPWSGTRPREK